MVSDEQAMQVFRQRAEHHDMNPREVEVDEKESGRFVSGTVDPKMDGHTDAPARISVFLLEREAEAISVEERIEFMVDWYAGETEHQVAA